MTLVAVQLKVKLVDFGRWCDWETSCSLPFEKSLFLSRYCQRLWIVNWFFALFNNIHLLQTSNFVFEIYVLTMTWFKDKIYECQVTLFRNLCLHCKCFLVLNIFSICLMTITTLSIRSFFKSSFLSSYLFFLSRNLEIATPLGRFLLIKRMARNFLRELLLSSCGIIFKGF